MKVLFRSVLVALCLLPLACHAAAPDAFTEGKEYKKVAESVAPADSKRVTVEEFFWYGCPHCFHADPFIASWLPKKAGYIDFVRIPNTLGRPEGEAHARAFYIADVLGVGEKIHKPLFVAIHEQHQPMNNAEQLRGLFASVAGVSAADFDKASSSFVVDSKMRRAEQLAKRYQITSVPTIVVGGKYYTNATMAGSNEKVMAVIDFLAEKARKER